MDVEKRLVIFAGMRTGYWIGIGLFLFCSSALQAQTWSKEDSVWLANVLSGKDTLRLNDETMRSIREGRFLQPDRSPAGTMGLSAPSLPITRDFSEYIRHEKDTSHYQVALRDLPPLVFWRYGQDLDPRDAMRYSGFNRDRQANQMVVPEMNGLSFNLAASLAYVFSPTYRQKVKNRKTATAYRTYDKMPSLAMAQKQRAYREAHPEKILSGRYAKVYREEEPLPDIIKRPKKQQAPAPDTLPHGQVDSLALSLVADSLRKIIPARPR